MRKDIYKHDVPFLTSWVWSFLWKFEGFSAALYYIIEYREKKWGKKRKKKKEKAK